MLNRPRILLVIQLQPAAKGTWRMPAERPSAHQNAALNAAHYAAWPPQTAPAFHLATLQLHERGWVLNQSRLLCLAAKSSAETA